MRSLIYWGVTHHERRAPREHRFSYPLFFFAVDLTELESGVLNGAFFRHGGFGVFQVNPSDYLTPGSEQISRKLTQQLQRASIAPPARVTLLTLPRVLGYCFAPVSFYLLQNDRADLTGIIAEVNNTFGEKHIYIASTVDQRDGQYHFPKEFFVSPFFPVAGHYALSVSRAGEKLSIKVAYECEQQLMFQAVLAGTARPFSGLNLCLTLLRFPLSALLTMTRIHLQAFRLHFAKSLQVYPKPSPDHPHTLRNMPGIPAKLRLWIMRLRQRAAIKHKSSVASEGDL